jgi:transposase
VEHHVGIDVSLELSSLCVLDATGKAVRETKVASEPEALVAFLRGLPIARVGLEAGPLSQWLYDGLQAAGYDARGIAQLLRMGWFRQVHRKSVPSQEVRALLGARKQLQTKVMDLEQTLRGLLRGFGLKVGDVSRGKLPARIRELAAGHAMLGRIVKPLLAAREAMWCEFAKLHREVLTVVKADQVCRRLMTVPGVGEAAS